MARHESGVTTLRRATAADAEAIATVHVRSWQEAYRDSLPAAYLNALDINRRRDSWAHELSVTPKERMPWVAVTGTEVIGFVGAGPSRDEGAPLTTGEVYAIYVLPDCWTMGIGRNLLAHAERDLAGHGYDAATLWVLADNDRARRFYELAGWRLDAGAEKMAHIGGADVREVRYRIGLR